MASVAEVRVDDVDVDDEMSSSDFIDICVDVVQDDMPKTMPAPDVGSENHNKRESAKNPKRTLSSSPLPTGTPAMGVFKILMRTSLIWFCPGVIRGQSYNAFYTLGRCKIKCLNCQFSDKEK